MLTGFISITQGNSFTRLASGGSYFNNATFYGYSGFLSGLPLMNSASVFIGIDTGHLVLEVGASGFTNLSLEPRKIDDLNNYFVGGPVLNGLYFQAYR